MHNSYGSNHWEFISGILESAVRLQRAQQADRLKLLLVDGSSWKSVFPGCEGVLWEQPSPASLEMAGSSVRTADVPSAKPSCFSNGAGVVSPGQLLSDVNSEESAAADSPLCPPACCCLRSTLSSVISLTRSWSCCPGTRMKSRLFNSSYTLYIFTS